MSYGLVVIQSCATENEYPQDCMTIRKTRTATPLSGTAVQEG